MMDQEIKRKWIEALRSGEYKQIGGTLWKGGHHCCLGVLVSIQGCKYISGNYPEEKFCAGLSDLAIHVLAAANDGVRCPETRQTMRKHSFKEIADYLEREIGI
jgi:hypothetical protein